MISSFFQWLVVVVVVAAVVFGGYKKLRPVRELLVPMWLPLSVLVIAGLALFATDQGQDLGVGVLDASHSRLALLAVALLYWATGTWHAARLGLNRRFGTVPGEWPRGYRHWLRWLPKLLGACAHLFAALGLALAAWHVIAPDAEPILFLPAWLLAFVPPAVIVVAVFVLWRNDLRYVAARDALEEARRNGDDRTGPKANLKAAEKRVRRTVLIIIAWGLASAAALYWLGDRLPMGLARGTGWVLVSAACFLLVVSYRKSIGEWVLERTFISEQRKRGLEGAFAETSEKQALSSTVLAGVLSVVALLVGFWAWWDPVSLGAAAGSMVLGFFAFGAYIAVIDLIRIVSGSGPRFAAVCVFLLLLAVGTSGTRDFHRVRLCGDALAPCPDGTAAASERADGAWFDKRPTVAEATRAWYAQASRGWDPQRPVPMLIVATAGGGIRAAYWTATVLERLEQALGKDVLRRHLFAISGVSGGSIGALAYMATAVDDPAAPEHPTQLLDRDFLAPAVAALAFVDGPSSVLPDIRQGDRGYALERAWEEASGGVLARPFLSFFPDRDTLGRNDKPWHPALLLNATHQGTGRRVITSHVKVERRVFLDSFDALDLVEADMPASTAGHNSARFTYVSPAGKLVPPNPKDGGPRDFGFLLDGGYFENFGAVTALQLLREARQAVGAENVRPIILQISSDPSLSPRDRARMHRDASLCNLRAGTLPFEPDDGGDWLSSFGTELTAPIAGIVASRVAHGTLASEELAFALCTAQRRSRDGGPPDTLNLLHSVKEGVPSVEADPGPPEEPAQYAHLVMCDEEGATLPPLGWTLSSPIRGKFVEILHQCGNAEELDLVVGAFAQQEM